MNIQLGYALLRDRRVPIQPKLIALATGAGVVGFIELLAEQRDHQCGQQTV